MIDTHIVIWAVLNAPKLPKKAKDIILDKQNDIFYSTASVWEITIKHMLHPDKLRMNGNLLEKGCEENGYFIDVYISCDEYLVFVVDTSGYYCLS